MISFFAKAFSKRSIVLDIQSDMVRGALIESGENNTTKGLSAAVRAIPESLIPSDSARMIKKILKLTHEVVDELVRESGHRHIASIHYILSSPWVFSEIKTLKTDYKGDRKISHDMIQKLVDSDTNTVPDSFDAYIFEKKVFDVKLNGYSTPAYEGKIAHTLEVSFSASFGSKSLMGHLQHAVGKSIHIKKHIFHSALLTQYSILGKMFSSKREYIYMHVHGELTDIIIVKDDLCRHIASFPCGIKTITRKLANALNHTPDSVDSLLTLYQENKLSEMEKQNAGKVIDSLLSDWSEMCMKAFLNSFDILHIPKTIFITAHSHAELFKDALIAQNKVNFEVVPYEDLVGTDQSALMNMYTHAVSAMI